MLTSLLMITIVVLTTLCGFFLYKYLAAKMDLRKQATLHTLEKINDKIDSTKNMLEIQSSLKASFQPSQNNTLLPNVSYLDEILENDCTFSLPKPLTETLRPKSLTEVVGQKEGIELLRAAICSDSPMNVIIYGPPGIGKTTVARILFEDAKKSKHIFKGKFIELDGTLLKFDERNSTNQLTGSIHEPIYQGANDAMAKLSIPEPKPGAVTEAHGGMLFIDEIGEMSASNLNKLLKVLEDRRVFYTSSYYNPNNKNIPNSIHYVFQHGLPADFRLIAATTRKPSEIPEALRNRCVEIFFRALTKEELKIIATNALKTLNLYNSYPFLVEEILECAKNPRDVIHLAQMASSYFETYGNISERKIYDFSHQNQAYTA